MTGLMGKDGVYRIKCSTAKNLKPLNIQFGTSKFTLSWDQQVILDLNGSQCIYIFQPSTDSNIPIIIGVSFLRNYFTIFDRGVGRMGLAKPTGDPALTIPNGAGRPLYSSISLVMVLVMISACI